MAKLTTRKPLVGNNVSHSMRHTKRRQNLNLPVGQYALFVKINDTLYRTDLVYQF